MYTSFALMFDVRWWLAGSCDYKLFRVVRETQLQLARFLAHFCVWRCGALRVAMDLKFLGWCASARHLENQAGVRCGSGSLFY